MHLGMKPFKIQLVQELKLYGLSQRRIFYEWAPGKLATDPFLFRKIVFSDETHFWLNEYVNKQNCRLWSEDQPEDLQNVPMHLENAVILTEGL